MLRDFLLPRTDAGVLVQLVLVLVVAVPLIWVSRKNRDIQMFAIGVPVFLIALMALRTLH